MNISRIVMALITLFIIIAVCCASFFIAKYSIGACLVVLSIAGGFSYFLYKDINTIVEDYKNGN
jgi:hypothetical protein